MVRALFCQDEAESILAIPLSFVDGEDFFVWHHTANGKFSVRSAYHVAVSLANQLQPSPSCIVPFLWKTIWKANVPGKIRIFIWKLAKNALPTGMNLQKELRSEGWGCPFCGSEQEDIEHAFLWCSIVRQICALSNLRIAPKSPPARWSPPKFGEVKLNFDGALFASSSEVGLGVIARDSAGACIWWKFVCKQGLFEPEMVEAFVAREAILLARRFGWRSIIIEGDGANLFLKLLASSPDCSGLGPIVSFWL
ncbi:UNVERIFIED_CONTAM: hypothetical protein Scaly_1826600 [Sesamum calycinum]|uniref:Reverse transcriptase zinc-binding domain-containing protein n=1 Tax=Sesamum calycinum TaxID=2727403 RepID=A0AAW2NCX0_9LAMI